MIYCKLWESEGLSIVIFNISTWRKVCRLSIAATESPVQGLHIPQVGKDLLDRTVANHVAKTTPIIVIQKHAQQTRTVSQPCHHQGNTLKDKGKNGVHTYFKLTPNEPAKLLLLLYVIFPKVA